MTYAIGLMSGTSLDGIDAALVKINSLTDYELTAFQSYPFSQDIKEKIVRCLSEETSSVSEICSLNFELAQLFGKAVTDLCRDNQLDSQDLVFVASHGQTLYHLPVGGNGLVASTLQIGESSLIAELAKTTVISDFRCRDMAVGGQGAPIVPFSEYILYNDDRVNRILQNIGGISNATVIPRQADFDDITAFDTGPGNMIIDELCRHFFQTEFDQDGQLASQGTVDHDVLSGLMRHPYFQKKPPKTTGREDFGKQFVMQLLAKYQLSPLDWIATATMFTAKSIAVSLMPYIQGRTEVIIGGGGSYNKTMRRMLQELLPDAVVLTQEDLGHSSEAKEAVAMVVLGNHTYHHLPSNVPSATGANRQVILGKVTYY
ncbi:anhydro-N-acetylmuramic acid kinase AnmK [Vagococcus acidifermentans]|uniref:Anhydro-N-acetylmuramic acid kinase n=1 Tax=Vagococcus acidifermentans TaxID=564710 RepID=A0A430AUN5_9ENTE|nr:anhydro-N-acetylmuramic acid kinase AnmK [Vagococcus acidifermentans]RSU11769.1 anhydro-N-acetylmuramic acid kinase [Vagococcus acidifermentans]